MSCKRLKEAATVGESHEPASDIPCRPPQPQPLRPTQRSESSPRVPLSTGLPSYYRAWSQPSETGPLRIAQFGSTETVLMWWRECGLQSPLDMGSNPGLKTPLAVTSWTSFFTSLSFSVVIYNGGLDGWTGRQMDGWMNGQMVG